MGYRDMTEPDKICIRRIFNFKSAGYEFVTQSQLVQLRIASSVYHMKPGNAEFCLNFKGVYIRLRLYFFCLYLFTYLSQSIVNKRVKHVLQKHTLNTGSYLLMSVQTKNHTTTTTTSILTAFSQDNLSKPAPER